MKHLVSLALVLASAACGVEPSTSNLQEQGAPQGAVAPISAEFIRLEGVEGVLESVRTRRERGATMTDVTIGFPMSCVDRLAAFAQTTTIKRNKAEILVSATKQVHQMSDRVRCMRANYEKKTITLKGSFRASDVSLVALDSQEPVALVPGDLSVHGISSATVTSAAMICPPNPNGFSCLAVGSRVELRVPLSGCVDRLGPVATRFAPRADGKVDLFVSLLNVATEGSMRTRCFAAPTAAVSVMTGYNVASPRDLVLHVLKN